MTNKKEGILSKIFKKIDEALKKKAEKASSCCSQESKEKKDKCCNG